MPRSASQTVTTQRQVDALKPGMVAYDVPVPDAPGLAIRVFPTGRKEAGVRYYGHGGTRRRLPLPGLRLEDARREALRVRGEVLSGRDPVSERRVKLQAVRLGDKLDDLWPRFIEAAAKGHHGGRGAPLAATTLDAMSSRYANHIAPALGRRPVVGVLRSDVRSFMRDMVESGLSPDSVNSVGRNLRSLLAYAVHLDLIAANPVMGLAEPLKGAARERMWSPDVLGKVLTTLEQCRADGVGPDVSRALRFAVLTVARRASAAGLRWEELDWNESCWVCPKERHKSKRVFLTPFTPAITSILREAGDEQFGSGADLIGRAGPVFRSDKGTALPCIPTPSPPQWFACGRR